MNRRHAVALILGLVIGLALLGRWAMSPDDHGDTPAGQETTIAQGTPDMPSIAEPADKIEPATAAAADATPATDAPDSGVFRGRIINAVTRQPVRAFDLEFHPVRRTRDSPKPPFHSFQTKDGRFECRGLPAGAWTILVTARGYQRFELADVEISSGKATQEALIPMRPGYALHGRVFEESTDDGIAGANLSFREGHVGRFEGDFRNRPSTLSQQDGAFVLDGLPAGPLVVTVFAEGYVSREVDVMAEDKMAPVEIGLSTGGTVAGYLAGTDGLTPVAGLISLVNLDQSSGGTMHTGSAGEFNFTRLAPGRYRLSGRGGGLSGEREIMLSNDEQLEGIVLAMRGGHNIRGVISGLRPEELQSAIVAVDRDIGIGHTVETNVDAGGAYTLTGVTAGKVRVGVRVGARGQISKAVEMPADTDLTLNLEFPRGSRVTGRVTRGGSPLAGVSVSPSAVPFRDDVFTYEVRTSASGEYVIENVPTGEYTLYVDYSYRSPNVRVSDDTVFDIDVPAAQLAGRLLQEGGKVPVVGATVHLWSALSGASRIRLSAQSDHFGQFAVRGLQPGDFVLSVYKPGYELYRGPLAYGSPISNMTISLRPARGVEIKVRDAVSGKAVNSVTAVEIINGQTGIALRLNLDQNGVGYVPSAIAGSTLKFSAMGYVPAEIAAWNGEGFEVSMQRQPVP